MKAERNNEYKIIFSGNFSFRNLERETLLVILSGTGFFNLFLAHGSLK